MVFKLFFVTDVHGSDMCFRKFLSALKVYKVNAGILLGDLSGKMINPIIEQPDGTYVCDFLGKRYVLKTPEELEEMKKKLRAKSAHVEIEFPYFVEKKAPVTGSRGLMEYICRFYGSSDHSDIDLCLEVNVPISTVCPCSKEISDHGAHNQRGMVRVRVRFKKLVWIEDVIRLVEDSASCDLYSILKRPDEKYVTERAYENPMFVEDVVREVATKLQADPNITWFSVEAENFESIHNHSAYAYVEGGLKVVP